MTKSEDLAFARELLKGARDARRLIGLAPGVTPELVEQRIREAEERLHRCAEAVYSTSPVQ